MRRAMRRTKRGTQRVFTVTWVVLALMLGIMGLRARRPHAAPHAAAPAGTQQVQPGANPEPSRAPLPAKPANNRNG